MSIPPPLTTPQEIRHAHLSHEASIQSIGALYYVGACFLPIVAVVSLFSEKSSGLVSAIIAGVLLLLAAAYFQLGRWFRALDPKARTPGTILAAIGLLGFPLGTLINAYILYLLQSKKGAMVFSDQYKEVIAATPEIKYKTSLIVWIFLGLVVLMLVAAVMAALFAK